MDTVKEPDADAVFVDVDDAVDVAELVLDFEDEDDDVEDAVDEDVAVGVAPHRLVLASQ